MHARMPPSALPVLCDVQLSSLCRTHSGSLVLNVGLMLQDEQEPDLPASLLGVLRVTRLDLEDCSRHRPLPVEV